MSVMEPEGVNGVREGDKQKEEEKVKAVNSSPSST